MKTENSIRPENYVIESIDSDRDECELIINTDIQESEIIDEDGTKRKKYTYQSYRSIVRYSDNLENELKTESGFAEWLNRLRLNEKNKYATIEREWRNAELNNTDKYMIKDYPAKYTEKTILDYRQALRDYPDTEDFPFGKRPKITDYLLEE